MFRRIVALIVCVAFISSNLHYSCAQGFNVNQLPVPGKMVEPAVNYVPLTLKGLVLHPEDALKFDFLMDTGNSSLQGGALKSEALKVMTYFLTSLTMKEDDMWVNLSPYEQGKVIENKFGNTVMGRDLLAEDYVLKQLTSSLVYPERELGQTFWKELYSKVDPSQLEEISIETINKVWIVPSEAVVWEHDGKVMIIKSHLRVMLDEDFVALKNSAAGLSKGTKSSTASQIVRDVVLPVLEKQVNEGEHFAQLRQMYQAMILATWYKKALKESIIARVYADKGKIRGVDNSNTDDIKAIYQQYLEAFKKGTFNYIREDVDPATGEIIPRKYFSGGFTLKMGIISLATALSIWSGTPTPAQAAEITQAVDNPVGNTVLVQGFAAEADGKGQPILLAQANKQQNTASSIQEDQTKRVLNLIRELKDLSKYVRRPAAQALGEIGDKSAVPALIEALKDEDPMTRQNAAIALGLLRDKSAVPFLISALEDKETFVRNSAVRALGSIGDPRAIPALRISLSDEYSSNEAIKSLHSLDASFWQLFSDSELLKIFLILATLGGSFAGSLVLYRKSVSYKIKLINQFRNLKQADQIQRFLYEDEEIVRQEARQALDQMITDPNEQFKMGLGVTSSFYSDNRIWALRMLVKSRNKNIAEIIEKLLNDDDYTVRDKAMLFFYTYIIDSKTQYRLGIQQLNSGHYDNRVWAIDMLQRSRDSKAVEPLASVLNRPLGNDDDYKLYNAASDALASFGDGRSAYLYQFFPEEGHEEGHVLTADEAGMANSYYGSGGQAPYGAGSILGTDWVADKPSYWEKVNRPTQASGKPNELGGIALDSRMMDLQIKRDGNGVPLPVSQQPLDEINIQGFVPQILDIKTINLIEFLGLNLTEDQALAKI